MRRDMPLLGDKILAGFGIFIIGFFIFTIVFTWTELNFMELDELNEPADITQGEFIELLLWVLLGFFILIANIIFDMTIGDYLHLRRRKVRD
jgi:hypothetical protein